MKGNLRTAVQIRKRHSNDAPLCQRMGAPLAERTRDTSGIMQGITLGRFQAILLENIKVKQPLEAIWWRIPPAPPHIEIPTLIGWDFFAHSPSEMTLFFASSQRDVDHCNGSPPGTLTHLFNRPDWFRPQSGCFSRSGCNRCLGLIHCNHHRQFVGSDVFCKCSAYFSCSQPRYFFIQFL